MFSFFPFSGIPDSMRVELLQICERTGQFWNPAVHHDQWHHRKYWEQRWLLCLNDKTGDVMISCPFRTFPCILVAFSIKPTFSSCTCNSLRQIQWSVWHLFGTIFNRKLIYIWHSKHFHSNSSTLSVGLSQSKWLCVLIKVIKHNVMGFSQWVLANTELLQHRRMK